MTIDKKNNKCYKRTMEERTQLSGVKKEYIKKLKVLSATKGTSMVDMFEILIDEAVRREKIKI